jgi:hypothetical protein
MRGERAGGGGRSGQVSHPTSSLLSNLIAISPPSVPFPPPFDSNMHCIQLGVLGEEGVPSLLISHLRASHSPHKNQVAKSPTPQPL